MTETPRHTLVVEPDRKGSGWSVRITPPIAQTETVVGDFKTEAEARAWAEQDSAEWIAELEASRK